MLGFSLVSYLVVGLVCIGVYGYVTVNSIIVVEGGG